MDLMDGRVKIYDISMKLTKDMPVYKGKETKKPVFMTDSDFTTGTAYESRLNLNMHTGTHIDRPLHILPDGAAMDTLDLSQVITKCKVFDFTEANEKISASELVLKDIAEDDFILLKTKNSFFHILENEFIYLDRFGADYLAEKKVKGVGIDSLGIERSQPEHETHKILLREDIVILEGLRLKEIEEGEYFLIAAPLNIDKAEAAPVRAVLLRC
ncbi:MAG TPA: cyclase family protein [Mobilitalea sp.]|nr:cyclase family protein [Mobilitalea sp.]